MANDFIPEAQAGEGAAPRGAPAPIDYRQIERPIEGITPYHLQHSGGAEHAEALQKVFREFGGAANAFAEQSAKKAGVAAGAAAGASPTGDGSQKTGLAALTTYGSSYNAAVQVAYLSRTKDNLATHIEQIRQDNEGDPATFEVAARAAAAAALKEAPNAYKPELEIDLNHMINAGIVRTREQQIQSARSEALSSYTDNRESRIQTLVKTSSALRGDEQSAVLTNALADDKSRLDALVKARAITPERAAQWHAKYNSDMATAVQAGHIDYLTSTAMDHVRAGDLTAGDEAWKKFINDPNNSEDDKNAFTKQYHAESTAYHEMQSRAHAEDVGTLMQRLVQGVYGSGVENQMHQMFKQSILSPEQLHGLLDHSMRNQVQAIDDDNSNKLVDDAMHGHGGLDPESATAKKAVDTYVKTHGLLSNMPPLSDTWTAMVSHIAKLTNILPPVAMAQSRISLVQGTAKEQAMAASALERIRADNPNLDPYDKDSKSAARASLIDQNLKVGMDPVRAVEKADAVLDRPEAIKKQDEANYTKIAQQNPQANTRVLQSIFNKATPGLFSSAPPVPNAMAAENERLTRDFFSITGDIGKAQQLAGQQLMTVWHQTSMNGTPELVKHGIPESQVPAVRADIATRAADWNYAGDPKDLKLIPNQFTDATNGGVWTVVHVDPKTGDRDVLLTKDNRTVVYSPPAPPDPAIALQKANDESLARAKAQRDAQRKNSTDQILFEQQLSDQYFSPHAGRRPAAGV